MFHKKKVATSLQETIPYQFIAMDGTIQTKGNEFSRAYWLEEVNFKNVSEKKAQRIFFAFESLLNTFPKDVRFQIYVSTRKQSKKNTLREVAFSNKADNYNVYRRELNQVISEKISKGAYVYHQQKSLVVSVKADHIASASKRLNALEEDLDKAIKNIAKDASLRRLRIEERLEQLYFAYHPLSKCLFSNDQKEVTLEDGQKKVIPFFNMELLAKAGLTSKDYIMPAGISFFPYDYEMEETRGCLFYLQDVPSSLSTDFFSDLCELPFVHSISLSYQPLDGDQISKMTKGKLLGIKAAIIAQQKNAVREGYSLDMVSETLSEERRQTQEIISDFSDRDQQAYFITFLINVYAKDKEELKENTSVLLAMANTKNVKILKAGYQQEMALNMSLPLCLNTLSLKRLYTTEAASVFLPYTAVDVNQASGFLYGVNETTKHIVMFDRLFWKNYNGLIFGSSGSGKSFAAKQEIVSALLRSEKNQIYVIDPEDEYSPLADALGGQVINVGASTRNFVNPMDMDLDYSGDGDPVAMKADYIISLVEIMAQGSVLDPIAKSIVIRCVQNIYRDYLRHMEDLRQNKSDLSIDRLSMPTLQSLHTELMQQPEAEAESIATVLEPYAYGSFATFSHRTNIDTQNRFVVYNTKNLGSGSKDLGLHVCLNDIWNKMIENRKKNIYTWIYIDEFHELLKSDSAAKFVTSVWERARKWNGVPTGIMQSPEALLQSPEARNIVSNTSFSLLFSLPTMTREQVGDLMEIEEELLEHISEAANKGQGLLHTGKATVLFQNDFPKDTRLFALMDTGPNRSFF